MKTLSKQTAEISQLQNFDAVYADTLAKLQSEVKFANEKMYASDTMV